MPLSLSFSRLGKLQGPSSPLTESMQKVPRRRMTPPTIQRAVTTDRHRMDGAQFRLPETWHIGPGKWCTLITARLLGGTAGTFPEREHQ
jgi:hypothetical protein